MLFEGARPVVGLDEVWGMNLVSQFPCVICFWVPLPLDKILKHSGPTEALVVDDLFHLVFLLFF
jgi:hypothetical protein